MSEPRFGPFLEFVATIEERLRQPLPGVSAQLRMAPKPRRGWKAGHIPEDTRLAAALLLLFPVANEPHVVLTVRASDLPSHRGQVSLPGGGVREGESIVDAAQREALEEIGVVPSSLAILGRLTPLHIPVSGFALHTIVAATREGPVFAPCAREVARLIEVSLSQLASPATLHLDVWSWGDGDRRVPYFRVDGETVWGATAMVLAEFLEIAGAPPDPWEGEGQGD